MDLRSEAAKTELGIAQKHTGGELHRESEVLVLDSNPHTRSHPSDPFCLIDGIAPVFD